MTQEEFQNRYIYDPQRDCLGRGGFGSVYRAHDTLRGRDVAIKISEVSQENLRLKHEVEIAQSLPEHRNIAHYEQCYTLSSFSGVFDVAVMQYYEAGSLEQILQTDKLDLGQRIEILTQLLDGIVYLHSHNIIHRDLKPQNILVDKYRGKITIKITDFGISKQMEDINRSLVSNSLVGVGTLSYASPEQLAERSIRRNTDLWSFGVIAFRMMTGELPFTCGSFSPKSEQGRSELMRQINGGNLPASIANVPSPWRELIERCITVDNKKRPQSAEECIALLVSNAEHNGDDETHFEDVIIPKKPEKPEQPKKSIEHHEPIQPKEPQINTSNPFAVRDKFDKAVRIAYVILAIIMFIGQCNYMYDLSKGVYGSVTDTYFIFYITDWALCVFTYMLVPYLTFKVRRTAIYGHILALYIGIIHSDAGDSVIFLVGILMILVSIAALIKGFIVKLQTFNKR